ncbi:hypothetical protein ACQ4PT_001408 [Festuca glaucescens]
MADPAGAASSPATAGKELDLDDMLAHLELREDELDDVVIPVEAVKEFQKDARWLAIDALLGRLEKVVHQGPWTFRGWAVLIEDYDGKEDPEKMTFNGMHIWAQIHGIPELYRKTKVIDDLARRIGKTKEVHMSPKLFFEGNYVRLRVMIDVNKPLMRFVSLMVEGEGRKRLAVKYEKKSLFCKRCGLLGHDHDECADGAWEPKDLQYGEWMLAVRRSNSQMEPRRFAAREPARGGLMSRGGYNPGAKKRSYQEAALDNGEDLKDTASSPGKVGPMDEDKDARENSAAKKQLDMNAAETKNLDNTIGTTSGKEETPPPPPPEYVNPRDRTKQRKTDPTVNDLATSAASLEGDRRAQ